MAVDNDNKVCLGLLCGIPASGKSSLAHQIQEYFHRDVLSKNCVLLLSYDQLIPGDVEKQLVAQSTEEGRSLWKSFRSQIVTCVDCLLNHFISVTHAGSDVCNILNSSFQHPAVESGNLTNLSKPGNVDTSLWTRFEVSIHNSMQSFRGGEGRQFGQPSFPQTWLVLVDDNMHYCSMRYEYCQLARKCEVGLCVIYVRCPIEEALQRNRSRREGMVEDHVIALMHARLEVPDSTKRPWEKYSTTVDTTGGVNQVSASCLQMISQATQDPMKPLPEEDMEAKVISRYTCSVSITHQADQILRRCVSQRMAESKGAGMCKDELKALSSALAQYRTAILTDMKQGSITLPFQPDQPSAADASKDQASPLFQFVHQLFSEKIQHL